MEAVAEEVSWGVPESLAVMTNTCDAFSSRSSFCCSDTVPVYRVRDIRFEIFAYLINNTVELHQSHVEKVT